MTQKGVETLEPDTTVTIQAQNIRQDIGLVECGVQRMCQIY